jgi:hypothetical protein
MKVAAVIYSKVAKGAKSGIGIGSRRRITNFFPFVDAAVYRTFRPRRGVEASNGAEGV